MKQPNKTYVGAANYFDRGSGDEWLEDADASPPFEIGAAPAPTTSSAGIVESPDRVEAAEITATAPEHPLVIDLRQRAPMRLA
jgi:hypothetical protein